MSKQRPTKLSPIKKREQDRSHLRQGLTRQKKADLIEVLLDLAQSNRGIFRQLTAHFDTATAPNELEAATRQAITDATKFDRRDIDRNFDYDSDAYDEVKRNLARMIAGGEVRLAMKLSLELMKQGSYQVEMSDEGIMSDDIEDCLSVVINALTTSAVPAKEAITWCSAMIESDRNGFIANKPLESLRKKLQAAEKK